VKGTTLAKRVVVSPNIEARKGDGRVRFLILHYTGMLSAEAACNWLCNADAKVSCHYLIDEAGVITQMVDEGMRAWHAGVSHWRGETDINSASIGIEIQNLGHSHGYHDFSAAQMDAVKQLSADIVQRNSIEPRHVLAHSDVAPGRKLDPGEKFDWRNLHAVGIGHWVPAEPLGSGIFLQMGDRGDAVQALQGMLHFYGYGLVINGIYDERTKIVVEAFQRHFRPEKVDGVADQSTVATLHKLLRAIAPELGRTV
jgi:N-acetylmuramoyl-L-alanine amidase